ncbi:MAG: hypothetical protein ACYDHU_01960 [Acidimicrobiales bacterium]
MGNDDPQGGTSTRAGGGSTSDDVEPRTAPTDDHGDAPTDGTGGGTGTGGEIQNDPDDAVDDAHADDAGDQHRPRGGGTWRTMTGWQRLQQSFYKPPVPRTEKRQPLAPVDFSKMSGAEVRARINQIDDTERKIGLAGSVLAAIFALIFTIPYMVSKIAVVTTVKPLHKTCTGHLLKFEANGKGPATCNGVYPASHYVFPLVVWLVFALAIFVTVRIGRRAPVAFALVLTGLAFGTFIVIVPFVVAGGWLLLRAWRTQRYGSPTARAPLDGYVRPGPREPRRSGSGPRSPAVRSTSGGSTSGGSTSAGSTSGGSTSAGSTSAGSLFRRRQTRQGNQESSRSVPAANKRYTPKAPPRKKPPPPD